ncbi:uncharacterized protein LOC134532608 isoform X2 [Bacillus rossius redtenbacheri]
MDTGSACAWLAAAVLLRGAACFLTVAEDSLCSRGSRAPALLRLEAAGGGAAALVELRPRARTAACPLVVLAPPGRLLAVRLVPHSGASPRLGQARGECSLRVMTSHSRHPAWELDLCNQSSLSRVMLMSVHNYQHAAILNWTVSEQAASRLQASGILLTVVTKGPNSCSRSGLVPCLSQGAFTLLCVPSALACDGHVDCPVGGFDEDESVCGLTRAPSLIHDLEEQDGHDGHLVDSVDSLAKALAHYGPWGYLMLGTLMCGTLLMMCGLWECCCRGKTSRRRPPLARPEQPSVYVIGGEAETAAPGVASAPPKYDELDQPPDYRALFPADKEAPKTPGAIC